MNVPRATDHHNLMEIIEREKKMDEHKCNEDVYENGIVVAISGILVKGILQDMCKDASEKTGQKIDWHYSAGRAVIKVVGNVKIASNFLKAYEGEFFKII